MSKLKSLSTVVAGAALMALGTVSAAGSIKPMGFGSFNTARRTIKGYGIMNMLRKGQIQEVEKGVVIERVLFINQFFGVVA